MNQRERRVALRVDIDIMATLGTGESRSACRLLNMCEKGFLIEADDALPVGGNMALAVPLPPGALIHCIVEIRHVNKRRLGALVIEISDDDRQRCQAYLIERRALRLTPAPPPGPAPALLSDAAAAISTTARRDSRSRRRR